FPADLGGGEYARASSFEKSSAPLRSVSEQPPPASPITDALTAGMANDVIIEITDSGKYVEELPDVPASGAAIELRATAGCWPTLMLDTNPWSLSGNEAGSVTLNGLLISGQGL